MVPPALAWMHPHHRAAVEGILAFDRAQRGDIEVVFTPAAWTEVLVYAGEHPEDYGQFTASSLESQRKIRGVPVRIDADAPQPVDVRVAKPPAPEEPKPLQWVSLTVLMLDAGGSIHPVTFQAEQYPNIHLQVGREISPDTLRHTGRGRLQIRCWSDRMSSYDDWREPYWVPRHFKDAPTKSPRLTDWNIPDAPTRPDERASAEQVQYASTFAYFQGLERASDLLRRDMADYLPGLPLSQDQATVMRAELEVIEGALARLHRLGLDAYTGLGRADGG